MDVEKIAGLLPEEPREGLPEWALQHCADELGEDITAFRREPVVLPPEWEPLMTAEDIAEREKATHRRWGAVCNCSACGEEYVAGYIPSCGQAGLRGIRLVSGDDGNLFDGYCEEGQSAGEVGGWVVDITETEHFYCPLCGNRTYLVREADLRCGRTYSIMVGSVEVVDGYTAVVGWKVSRKVDEFLMWETHVTPREAMVIDERGRLRRFSHVKRGWFRETPTDRWEERKRYDDFFQTRYYSWESYGHNKVGGVMWPDVPDLAGTTGEKTGIDVYAKREGCWPLAYLRLWREHPAVENLLKAGLFRTVESGIDQAISSALNYGWRKLDACNLPVDWRYTRPHQMLSTTRPQMDIVRNWKIEELAEYRRYIDSGGEITAAEFDEKIFTAGLPNIRTITDARLDGERDITIDRACRYIREKTDCSLSTGLEMLHDIRRMGRKLSETGEVPPELKWPKNLRAVHDRLAEQIEAMNNAEKNAALQAGFDAVLEKCGGLEWTDGDLCIRLPRGNGELVAEGRILRHCVGGYGNRHAGGENIILFVRRYRRPERSYYTLNISLKGEPREIQLHGYGNEWHGEHKEHRHRIPPKVRAFVDRWKTEVLMPWYYDQQKKRGKMPRKSKQKENAA